MPGRQREDSGGGFKSSTTCLPSNGSRQCFAHACTSVTGGMTPTAEPATPSCCRGMSVQSSKRPASPQPSRHAPLQRSTWLGRNAAERMEFPRPLKLCTPPCIQVAADGMRLAAPAPGQALHRVVHQLHHAVQRRAGHSILAARDKEE